MVGQAKGEPEETDMDFFEMIQINCQFKPQIQRILGDLEQLYEMRSELEERFTDMREQWKDIQKY